MIQTIIPKNKEHWLDLRLPNINSTEISALFGISPYCTPYELFHRKRDKYEVNFLGNQRTEWGLALQEAIANKAAKDKGWTVRPMPEYIFDDELHLGASYDFAINDDGIMEVKNVDYLQFKKEWIENENGDFECPLWIEIQVQQELMLSKRLYCWVAALVGGNDLKLVKRTIDPKVQTAILSKTAEFWKAIADNKPPAPDFEADSDFIAKQYNFAEPGKIVDVTEDDHFCTLTQEYMDLKSVIKFKTERCEGIKAELLTRLGDAEKAIAPNFSISAGVVGPTWIEAFERKGYRNFRVNEKKKK